MLKIKSFVFSPIQENTYLLYNELNECLIIDPGCYFPEEKDELKGFITKSSLLPRMLLNTHCHLQAGFVQVFINGSQVKQVGYIFFFVFFIYVIPEGMAGKFRFNKGKFGKFRVIAAQHFTFHFIIQFGTPVLRQVTDVSIGKPFG